MPAVLFLYSNFPGFQVRCFPSFSLNHGPILSRCLNARFVLFYSYFYLLPCPPCNYPLRGIAEHNSYHASQCGDVAILAKMHSLREVGALVVGRRVPPVAKTGRQEGRDPLPTYTGAARFHPLFFLHGSVISTRSFSSHSPLSFQGTSQSTNQPGRPRRCLYRILFFISHSVVCHRNGIEPLVASAMPSVLYTKP